jgi:hypothetical protein
MSPSAAFRGESRLTTKEKLVNILVNTGFTLETDFWTQHGAYRKKEWDLAVWGCQASYKGHTYSIFSWDTMTAIVKAGGVAFDLPLTVADGIEISAHSVKTAEGLASAGEQGEAR